LETLTYLLNIAKVAVGLGFVIFIHELGHFLLAKWNGVKVEKFSIGFGPTLLGFRRGETEYVLAAVPLGGFVKMLGENPEDETSKSTDPRAFPNKSVGARMAIISAGVIMNVILGLACFVYAYGQGMDEIPAIIGTVKPGSPAYRAGIRPGDEVVSLDGRDEINFMTMNMTILHSASGQKLHFVLKRPGNKELIPLDVVALREGSAPYPRIGVSQSTSLILSNPPLMVRTGASLTQKEAEALDLKPGDLLIALGPEGSEPVPVHNYQELEQQLVAHRSKPLVFVFERTEKKPDHSKTPKPARVTVTLPPNPIVDLGLRMTIGPIMGIRPGSPAEQAGFREGDQIITIDGSSDFDPMRLGEICYDHAGQSMTFEVERKAVEGKTERVTLNVVPDSTPPLIKLFDESPEDVPGLGLAYTVIPKISAVREGSLAEKLGLIAGDEVTKLTVPPGKDDKKAKAKEIPLGLKSSNWPLAFALLQIEGQKELELTVKRLSKPIKIRPEPVEGWYNPQRGLQFENLERRLPPQSAGAALRRGADDTLDNILKIYALLRSLVQSRVSPTLLGGPIMIAQAAYSQAETGLTELIHFLGLLSINLAVLNFLPVPPLDGGQMVFLIAEKVRGKPLPESAVVAGSWVGIAMLLCLMLFVMFQDVLRWFF